MADIDIYSPDQYASGPPHELFTELRRTEPVCWQDVPGQAGYWAVLRHADLVEVARQPELFSASTGGVIIEDPPEESLESMRRMLLAMDPPLHGTFRRPVAPSFRARVIGGMEDQVRSVVRTILAEAAEKGTVEFVQEVAALVPSRVFGQMMGLPPADLPHLHHLAEMLTSSQDPEFEYAGGDTPTAAIEMAMYAIEFAEGRRAGAAGSAVGGSAAAGSAGSAGVAGVAGEPPADLTTLLLGTEFGGEPMDDMTFGSFFVQMVTAGNDTTKTMLTAGLLTLLDHPEQLAAVRADRSLLPMAVEEMLRYDNPLHYFRRTAMDDTVLAGQKIKAGDKVAMIYTSANRDEAVFEQPMTFDISRHPNPHLSFGIGEHFCLGSHLARLEARVFFEELFARFDRIEVAGTPVRVRSNLNNAYRQVPIHLGG